MAGFDVLTRGDALDSALQARDYLITCGVPAALSAKDPRLWGRRSVDHGRLGWLDLPFASRELLERLDGVVGELRYSGLDHVVLIGLGAESLAAQAVAAAAGEHDPLTILDGGDSAALNLALDRLDRTVIVLSSKVGVSIEGDAYRRIFVEAFRKHGLSDREIAGRFLVITDHGSPLDDFARRCGYRVGLTDPDLPGHFGALSAYGLVPALLTGADVAPLLDQAAAVAPALAKEEDNPGLLLGAVLGGCAQQSPAGPARDKLVLRDASGAAELTGWISQLLATGTGRHGRGILPLEPPGHPAGAECPDVHALVINPRQPMPGDSETSLWASPGAQFLVWEYATTVAGWLLGVNPFESGAALAQEAEDDTAAMLLAAENGPLPTGIPTFSDGDIDVYADPGSYGLAGLPAPHSALEPVLRHRRDLSGTIDALLHSVPPTGYLSIVTYLSGDFSGRYLAPGLARRAGRPVTYGPGPGLLHATGSFHKDGPGTGAFLVITGGVLADHPVPGRPYSLGKLQLARALADLRSLRRRGLPALWLHLRDPVAGAARLIDLVREPR
ncbi:phosphoheptose isomerase [Actinomadura craniellae]|uniref:Phosphoheptose isomerase n=1 Tax=Actinomadura craniellae TaxID=2231787 RepID=A0A365H6L1_9ACTN|nr:phosphoheptose isomerase [Actinomadura craniellae]RAY13903.1 phosphoheptose isomerase [Actinomadura craniellae]